MLLIYVSAGVVLFKYLGAESLCKFKFYVVCVCVCVADPQCPLGLRRVCMYRRSLVRIAGSIAAGVTGVCVFRECCVLSH